MNTTKRLPWFPMLVSDWLLSLAVLSMTPEQRGLYIQLLCWQWHSGGALSDDDANLQLLAGADREQWLRSKDKVLEQFERGDGLMFNAKLRQLMNERGAWHDKLSEAGKRGMRKRWGSGKQDAEPRADNPECNADDSSHSPKPNASAAAERLSALLSSEIRRNKPDYRITQAQLRKWAVTADRMLRLDGRSEEQVSRLIEWVQRDEFWMANCLSMDKLREKFDQLELKRQQGNGNYKRPTNTQKPAISAVDELRASLAAGDQTSKGVTR